VPDEYKQLPLVGKCCPIGEGLVRDTQRTGHTVCASLNDTSNNTVYFSPYFSDFNRTGAMVHGDEVERFVAVVGNPCRLKYVQRTQRRICGDLNDRICRESHVTNHLTEGRPLYNIK